MKFNDLRYLAAYLVPLACFGGLYFQGWAAPGTLYLGFFLVPLIELFVPAAARKEDEADLIKKSRIPFFDYMLYLNLPAL